MPIGKARIKDYTGYTVGFLKVIGRVDNFESMDQAVDPVWIVHCSKYNISTRRNSLAIRNMRRLSAEASGANWIEYHQSLIGKQFKETSLTILEFDYSKPLTMVYCRCSKYNIERWTKWKDICRGVSSLKSRSGRRPEGLLLDDAVDKEIGNNTVSIKSTKVMSDGRYLTYYSTTYKGKVFRVHRLAYEIMTGETLTPECEIHHINHDTLDNRISNLRRYSKGGDTSCNVQSQHKRKRTSKGKPPSSEFVGVYKASKTRWGATIGFLGKSIHLGWYKTELEALMARESAVQRLNETHGTDYITEADRQELIKSFSSEQLA